MFRAFALEKEDPPVRCSSPVGLHEAEAVLVGQVEPRLDLASPLRRELQSHVAVLFPRSFDARGGTVHEAADSRDNGRANRFTRNKQLAADGLDWEPPGRLIDQRERKSVLRALERELLISIHDFDYLTAVRERQSIALQDLRRRIQPAIELGDLFGENVLHKTPRVIGALGSRAPFKPDIGILSHVGANFVSRFDNIEIALQLFEHDIAFPKRSKKPLLTMRRQDIRFGRAMKSFLSEGRQVTRCKHSPMATRVSIANVARFSVGTVAIVWALLGLGDALAAGMGRGVDGAVVAAVIVNAALILSGFLAFARLRFWRVAMIVCTVAVTVDRVVGILGTGDWWLALSSIAMLAAIIGISAIARGT